MGGVPGRNLTPSPPAHRALQNFNFPFPHEHIMQIAEKFADANQDGEIDYAEFAAALHQDDLENPEYFLKGRTKGVGDCWTKDTGDVVG